MRPSCRRLFVWAFAAFFAGISLAGQGLHYFVEHGSHAAPRDVAEQVAACAHHGRGHAHACCHDRPGHDRQHPADRDTARVAPGAPHPHDCVICAYFAQAQRTMPIEPARLEFVSFPVVHVAEQAARIACVGVYHSRAPPAAAPIC
jgi:hypothetical protein